MQTSRGLTRTYEGALISHSLCLLSFFWNSPQPLLFPCFLLPLHLTSQPICICFLAPSLTVLHLIFFLLHYLIFPYFESPPPLLYFPPNVPLCPPSNWDTSGLVWCWLLDQANLHGEKPVRTCEGHLTSPCTIYYFPYSWQPPYLPPFP